MEYFNIGYFHLGTYLLSLVAFLYLLIIFMNIRTERKNKELILFISFIVIIVSDILNRSEILINQSNQNVYNFLHIIILNIGFFILSSINYKDSPKKIKDILKHHKDIIYFIISTALITALYIIYVINIFNEVFINRMFYLALLGYNISTLLVFINIFLKNHLNYAFKITFPIKALFTVYLITFIFIIIDFLLVITQIGALGKIDNEALSFININLKIFRFSIYLMFALFGILKIYLSENDFIKQLLEFTKSKKGEFKTLDIIENLVLESEEFDSTLDNILNIAVELTKSDGGIIYIYDKDSNEFIGRKISGYVVPPFFVHDKILEDGNEINKKILVTRVGEKSMFFEAIKSSEETILVQREGDEDSRKCLASLREYADNIGSIIAGKILIDDELFGIIILEEIYSNYAMTDVNIFKAICSFSGVLIKNIRSKSMEKERERLKNEMKIAEQIQTGILPRTYNIDGFTISALMKPADEVGGDYYDILTGPDGNYWANIGDVTGHGVTAGLIMMMLQTSSTATINSIPDISPKDLAIICNKIIFENVQNRLLLDQFITTCFMKFRSDGFFEYSGAHEDILIMRNATDNVEVLKTKGIWLGLMEDISHGTTLNSFNLFKGDVLLIYTDGVIEIRDKDNVQYDTKRLIKFLKKNGRKEPEIISQLLLDDLENFKHIQKDDITYLVIRKD